MTDQTSPKPELPQPAGEQFDEWLLTVEQAVRERLVYGRDYGNVEGIKGNMLFKAGAEKLAAMFSLYPVISVLVHESDPAKTYERPGKKGPHTVRGYYEAVVKITLIRRDTNEVVAEGIGACNSAEKGSPNAGLDHDFVLDQASKRAFTGAVMQALCISFERPKPKPQQGQPRTENGSMPKKPTAPIVSPEVLEEFMASAEGTAFVKKTGLQPAGVESFLRRCKTYGQNPIAVAEAVIQSDHPRPRDQAFHLAETLDRVQRTTT